MPLSRMRVTVPATHVHVRHDAGRRTLNLYFHRVVQSYRTHCRSLGDSIGESVGVFAEPEQLVLNVSKHDKYIVIASDGVFEFITSHKVWCNTGRIVQAIAEYVWLWRGNIRFQVLSPSRAATIPSCTWFGLLFRLLSALA